MRGYRPSFRERLMRFMAGRYGTDTLSKLNLGICLILSLINIFLRSPIISLLTLPLLIWVIFRTFSRNIYARQRENARLLRFFNRVRGFFKLRRSKHRDRKTHAYRKCPSCKSMLRLPRVKGEHTVKCPRCSHRFSVKI